MENINMEKVKKGHKNQDNKYFLEILQNKPLISIILPTYNRENTIVMSVESVLKQTYTNFELIIIDDGSNDLTDQYINNINDKRIKFFRNDTNMGPAISRNIGVNYASSNIIAFHDSDDIWEEDKLEKQLMHWQKNPEAVMVYSRYKFIFNNKIIEIPERSFKNELLEGNIFTSLLSGNKVGTPTIMMRADYFNKVGGFDISLKALEDWDLAIRIAREGEIAFVKESLVTAFGKTGGVNSNNKNVIDAQISIIKKWFDIENAIYLEPSILYLLECIAKSFKDKSDTGFESLIVPSIIPDQLSYRMIISALNKKIKMEENYHLLVKMHDKDKCKQQITNYFNNYRWKTMAIYGYGYVGKVFNTIVQETEINTLYVIDKENVGSGQINIKRGEEIDSVPDVIIVTIYMGFHEIKEYLKQYTCSRIIYIGEILS